MTKCFTQIMSFIGAYFIFIECAHSQTQYSHAERQNGQCYEQCYKGGALRPVADRVLLKEASFRYEVRPTKYRRTGKPVLVVDTLTTLEVIPPVFETVSEQVLVADRYYRLAYIPAKYTTRRDSVLVYESYKKLEVVPATFKKITQQILVKEKTESYSPRSAVFEDVTKSRIIKEATPKLIIKPEEYYQKDEKVLTREESKIVKASSTKFLTTQVREIMSDSIVIFQKSYDPNCTSTISEDCIVICAVKVPARYQIFARQVVKEQAAISETPISETFVNKTQKLVKAKPSIVEELVEPTSSSYQFRQIAQKAAAPATDVSAVYQNIDVTVVDVPAHVKEIIVPAKYDYKTVQIVSEPARVDTIWTEGIYRAFTKQVLKTPAQVRRKTTPPVFVDVAQDIVETPVEVLKIEEPAIYQDITKYIATKDANDFVLEEVLCDAKISYDFIRSIENKLRNLGYKTGGPVNVSRKLGELTRVSIEEYQRKNNLPIGHLNLKTLKHLGLNI